MAKLTMVKAITDALDEEFRKADEELSVQIANAFGKEER